MGKTKLFFYNLFASFEKDKVRMIDFARRCEERRNVRKFPLAELSADQRDSIHKLWGNLKTNEVFWAFYTNANGKFDARYVPDDLYYTSIDAFYNDRYGHRFIDNKCYYDMFFPEVKRPKGVARRINGFWLVNNTIVSLDEVYDRCHQLGTLFLKKATEAMDGLGVFRLVMSETDKKGFFDIISKISGDMVIQEAIIQHSAMSAINPYAVNDIRIMTWLNKRGEIVVLSKVLRIGVGKSYVDNTGKGGLVIGIDENGCLRDWAYFMSGEKVYSHPTTGVSFKGIQLPSIEKAVEITKLHAKFPHYRLISWDIAIDQYGDPVLIEFNIHHGELDFHQICNGPLFGERTKEMLEEVFGDR